jgi:hypothetical protein
MPPSASLQVERERERERARERERERERERGVGERGRRRAQKGDPDTDQLALPTLPSSLCYPLAASFRRDLVFGAREVLHGLVASRSRALIVGDHSHPLPTMQRMSLEAR